VGYSFCLRGLSTTHQDFYILRRYIVGHVVVVVYENYVKQCLKADSHIVCRADAVALRRMAWAWAWAWAWQV
jgi:hypothetical protein